MRYLMIIMELQYNLWMLNMKAKLLSCSCGTLVRHSLTRIFQNQSWSCSYASNSLKIGGKRTYLVLNKQIRRFQKVKTLKSRNLVTRPSLDVFRSGARGAIRNFAERLVACNYDKLCNNIRNLKSMN